MTGRLPRPTAVEWLLLAVGVALTIHYAWILDDAYVYFRYIDNFNEYGFGWVYNEGEYVEGYTSPLWLMLLTLLRKAGLDYWLLVRMLGVVAFTVFWWGLVVLARDLTPARANGAPVQIVNLPLVFLASNYATLCYFTSGVEAPLANIAAVAYALFLVRPGRRLAGLMVAVSPLARPELALALALVVLLVWYKTRRFPWRVVTTSAVTIGGWLLFRVYYYADLLPNTFYLKHESLLLQGLAYLHQSLATYAVYPLALAMCAGVVALRRRGVSIDGWVRVAMLVIAAAVTAYIVRIGGDPRHHRYLAFAFCLAACSTAGLTERLGAMYLPRLPKAAWTAGAIVAAVLLATLYPPQLSGHPFGRGIDHFPVDLVNDAEFHRSKPGLSPPAWSLSPLGAGLVGPEAAGQGLETGLERTPKDWRSGYQVFDSDLWCFEHYWQLHRGVTHGAGLTDAFLARTIARSGRPAHKPKLHGRAKKISKLRERYGASKGMYRRALAAEDAPRWVSRNLESLELIEQKIYNSHDFTENLALALSRVPKVR